MQPDEFATPSLVVLVGPPGAGKTTWLDENLPEAVRVDLEQIRRDPDANRSELIDAAVQRAFDELRAGNLVAFDSTALRPQMRARLRGIAREVDVPVYGVVFDVALDDLLAAQKTRTHPVPDNRVRELSAEFEEQKPRIYAERWDGLVTVTRTAEDRTVNPNIEIRQILPTEPADALAVKLGKLLADAITMYLHAHGAHWVVKGGKYGTFAQWHSLFGDIYDDVHDSLDPLAENIQKLGYDAPFRVTDILMRREVEDPTSVDDDPAALARLLLEDNEELLECLNEAFAAATSENQQGIANFLADRIDAHQKWAWQLNASLGESSTTESDDDTTDGVDEEDEAETSEPSMLLGDDAMMERAFSPARLQYRNSGAGKQYRVIQGYVARTNSMSDDLGGFREIIAPGAFRDALRNADGSPKDIRLLYSHNVEAVLARTGVNMELDEDELGLRMWARVDMSDPDVARVASKMEQGLVDAASFGFTVAEDDWTDGPAYPIRTIRKIDMCFEVTICAWPAYPATRVSIMEDAIRSGRLPVGGAARTAPDLVGVSSRDALSGSGTRSAAAWQARLSLRKTQSKRYLP